MKLKNQSIRESIQFVIFSILYKLLIALDVSVVIECFSHNLQFSEYSALKY